MNAQNKISQILTLSNAAKDAADYEKANDLWKLAYLLWERDGRDQAQLGFTVNRNLFVPEDWQDHLLHHALIWLTADGVSSCIPFPVLGHPATTVLHRAWLEGYPVQDEGYHEERGYLPLSKKDEVEIQRILAENEDVMAEWGRCLPETAYVGDANRLTLAHALIGCVARELGLVTAKFPTCAQWRMETQEILEEMLGIHPNNEPIFFVSLPYEGDAPYDYVFDGTAPTYASQEEAGTASGELAYICAIGEKTNKVHGVWSSAPSTDLLGEDLLLKIRKSLPQIPDEDE